MMQHSQFHVVPIKTSAGRFFEDYTIGQVI